MVVPIGFVDAWTRMRIATDSEPMYCALAWRVATPPFDQADADALINEIAAALDGAVSSEITFDGGFVLVGSDGGDLRYDVTTTRTGTLATGMLPNNCAYLIRKNTTLGGRRNRGRMYLPGVLETNASPSGVLTAASITTAQTAVNLLLVGPLSTGNVDQAALLHQVGSPTPTQVVSFDVQSQIATQRRRMRP